MILHKIIMASLKVYVLSEFYLRTNSNQSEDYWKIFTNISITISELIKKTGKYKKKVIGRVSYLWLEYEKLLFFPG